MTERHASLFFDESGKFEPETDMRGHDKVRIVAGLVVFGEAALQQLVDALEAETGKIPHAAELRRLPSLLVMAYEGQLGELSEPHRLQVAETVESVLPRNSKTGAPILKQIARAPRSLGKKDLLKLLPQGLVDDLRTRGNELLERTRRVLGAAMAATGSRVVFTIDTSEPHGGLHAGMVQALVEGVALDLGIGADADSLQVVAASRKFDSGKPKDILEALEASGFELDVAKEVPSFTKRDLVVALDRSACRLEAIGRPLELLPPSLESAKESTSKGLAIADVVSHGLYGILVEAKAPYLMSADLLRSGGPTLFPPQIPIHAYSVEDPGHRILDALGAPASGGAPQPPRLLAATQALLRARANAKSAEARDSDDALIALEGIASRCERAITEVDRALSSASLHLKRAACRQLVQDTHVVLDARGGNYEAAEEALRRWWDPADGPRAAISGDGGLALRGWTARMAVANHRGDVERAQTAHGQGREAVAGHSSLRTLLDLAHLENLNAVRLQNLLPLETHDPELLREVADEALRLEELAHSIQELGKLGHQRLLGIGTRDAARTGSLDAGEEALWKAHACKSEPAPIDREVGMLLGTAGRSHGFLGDLPRATSLLLEARTLFRGGDRFLNASFLALVALESLRLGHDPRAQAIERFESAFNLLWPSGERNPEHVLASFAGGNDGFRFSLDLLLRALALGYAPLGVDEDSWASALADRDGSALRGALTRMDSHPSELVGRHAGEWLRTRGDTEASESWFALAVGVRGEGGGTLDRLRVFTEALAAGREPEGCDNTLLNPTFEYR